MQHASLGSMLTVICARPVQVLLALDRTVQLRQDAEVGEDEILDGIASPAHFHGSRDIVNSAEISPDRKYVLTSSGWSWRLFDAETSELLHKVNLGVGVQWASFSPSGTAVVAVPLDKTARLFTLPCNPYVDRPGRVLRGHKFHVASVSFSHDEHRVVTTAGESSVRQFVALTGELETTHIPNARFKVNHAIFMPCGNILAACANGCALLLDSRNSGTLRCFSTRHRGHVRLVAASPCGGRVLLVSRERLVQVYTASGEHLHDLDGGNDGLITTSAAFNTDSGGNDGCPPNMRITTVEEQQNERVARLFELQSGECKRIVRMARVQGARVSSAQFMF